MSEIEDVEAAEARMNRAKQALLSYVEQKKSLDRDHYHRLAARVKKAEADFRRIVAEIG